MPPFYLCDAERPLRDITIQDRYRFWIQFTLRNYVYKRWFSSKFERDNYRDFQIPGAVDIQLGEDQTRTTGSW